MSQLFPRWANSAVRAALIVGITLLAGAPIALLAWARSPSATGQYAIVDQPVAFSHPLHVNGERIDCRYCHAGAERSAMAGLPPTSACIGSHKEDIRRLSVLVSNGGKFSRRPEATEIHCRMLPPVRCSLFAEDRKTGLVGFINQNLYRAMRCTAFSMNAPFSG